MTLTTVTGLLLILVPLLGLDALCGLDILRLSGRREKIKEDYSQVNSIRYGLLSVDSWKARLQSIVDTSPRAVSCPPSISTAQGRRPDAPVAQA